MDYETNSFVGQIYEGMQVVDAEGKKVGTVKYFQAPSSSVNPTMDEFPPNLLNDYIPDEIVARLLREGFVVVNAGLLAKDRFVFLDEVEVVSDDRVYLTEQDARLLKF